MPAAVESMLYTGAVPWHGLGTHVEEAPTSKIALEMSGLDWGVELRPITFKKGTGNGRIVIPDQHAVVRVTDNHPLGVVGRRYKPLQNADAFAFADSLVSEGGSGDLVYETAGSLKDGRLVWMLARMDGDRFEVVPGDEQIPYMLLANRHDGGGSFIAKLTFVRVVCHNTYSIAVNGAGATVRIRHLGQVSDKLDDARKMLGLTRSKIDVYREQAEALAAIRFTTAKLDAFTEALYPSPTTTAKHTGTRTANKRLRIVRYFEDAPGNDVPGVSGTAWAAVNAVTYLTSHEQHIRGREGDEQSERRLHSAWFGTGAELNLRAMKAALAA